MPTLLVTRRMSPELAARVRASVSARRAAARKGLGPRSISLLRFLTLASVFAAVCGLVVTHDRRQAEFVRDHDAFLDHVRRASASLGPRERSATGRVESWLRQSSGPYAGDLVADELQAPRAFAAALARPTVYVRGPIASFRDPTRIAESAASSFKDAFVLCLVDPPAARTEKLLLKKARAAAGGRKLREVTAHVERLEPALTGLPFLARAFEDRVRAADDRPALEKLQRRFEQAPIDAAKRSARAELLLFALDEPGDGTGVTELDGERPHEVRVGLIELDSGRALLRLRRRVDPRWLSADARAEYASAIDGCALAFDVHARVTGAELARGE